MKIVVASLLMTSFMACKKDEDGLTACEQLEGTWTFSSWQEDGEEFLGDSIFITSSSLTFETISDGMGDFEWNISYIIGGDEMIIGAYRPDEACETMTITPKGGTAVTYDFSIQGETLMLETQDNNVSIHFELTRD
jgi:hypothetical protein